MAQNSLIAGLDMGSSKIRVLIAARNKDGELELISKLEENSDGIRRGVVIDIERNSSLLKNIFAEVSNDAGQKVDSVYININGSHLFSFPSKGLISVSRADQKISEEDIQRVLQAAEAINLSSNKEIFDTIPREFIIDGERGIKEPVGLNGVRVEVDVLALGGFSPYLKNLNQAVLKADLGISDRIPSPLSSAKAVLTEKQKELGTCVLDIGAGTTGISVFEEGDLIHLAVLPVGSSNITNDIAVGLKIDVDIAERIKIEYGSCFFKGKDVKRKIDIGEDSPLIFSQRFLTRIIQSRISEIFDETNKELKKISKEKSLPGGIVLTGGGAKLEKIIDLAKDKFHLPTRLGKPKGILGLDEDPSWSVAAGLVALAVDSAGEETAPSIGGGWLSRLISGLKKVLKVFVP